MNDNATLLQRSLAVYAQMRDWYTVHATLCVALAHPLNRGSTRQVQAAFVRQLGMTLVDYGVMSETEAKQYWATAGITETEHVIRDEVDRCPTCNRPLVEVPSA